MQAFLLCLGNKAISHEVSVHVVRVKCLMFHVVSNEVCSSSNSRKRSGVSGFKLLSTKVSGLVSVVVLKYTAVSKDVYL